MNGAAGAAGRRGALLRSSPARKALEGLDGRAGRPRGFVLPEPPRQPASRAKSRAVLPEQLQQAVGLVDGDLDRDER